MKCHHPRINIMTLKERSILEISPDRWRLKTHTWKISSITTITLSSKFIDPPKIRAEDMFAGHQRLFKMVAPWNLEQDMLFCSNFLMNLWIVPNKKPLSLPIPPIKIRVGDVRPMSFSLRRVFQNITSKGPEMMVNLGCGPLTGFQWPPGLLHF